MAAWLLKSTCHAQADLERQLKAASFLYERQLGRDVRGPAHPDGAAKPQLGGSDDSRGQQTAAALSQRQPPAQSQLARCCAILRDETPPFMPLTQEPDPLTGKPKSRQQGRLLDDLPSSSTEALQDASRPKLWSLLNNKIVADTSEASKQRRQHEGHMQANIHQIQAQNQAIAAEQHAGGVSGMPLHEQPVRSREEVEAEFAAVVQKERETLQKQQPGIQQTMLLRQCSVLRIKLYDCKMFRKRLAQLPPDSYGGLHRQAL